MLDNVAHCYSVKGVGRESNGGQISMVQFQAILYFGISDRLTIEIDAFDNPACFAHPAEKLSIATTHVQQFSGGVGFEKHARHPPLFRLQPHYCGWQYTRYLV